MSKFDNHKSIIRYSLCVALMIVICIAVVIQAGRIVIVDSSYWGAVKDKKMISDSITLKPTRGNILSSDGQVLAMSLPEYILRLDFNAMHISKADTLWAEKEDSICQGLHEIFPTRSAEEFRSILRKGKEKGSKNCTIWPRRVNYITYLQVKELPIFRLSQNVGGFYTQDFNARRRPYGSIAARTIGEVFLEKDTAKCGLELSFDSLLRGQNGLMHKRKINRTRISFIDQPAVNGADIVTTIDVSMQDIAERALLDELKLPEVNGEMGVAIVMEVETGDIKAIVNLTKCDDGEYHEVINSAVNYRCEPGSVFKPASILVALDDGVCDTSTVIHTGGGVMHMHSRDMKDHNWSTQGGYGDINVARSLEVSSNIGVSWIIDQNYASNPQKYLDGLARIGMAEDLNLPIVGYLPPIIKGSKLNAKGLAEDKTRLPWMSIGYNTQIAPINTLTFYNAVANNGKMVRPRFVKAVMKDGEVIKEYPVEVIKEHIAKPSSIKTLQTVLRHVVSQGLGKKAGSPLFQVSGKTGTAQVSRGAEGYKGGGPVGYWLSFAGYFPSDAPRYSCIVCIKKWGLPASGGGMSGVVFRQIAEGIMAKDLKCDISDAIDDPENIAPKHMKSPSANPDLSTVPNVIGMGAKDAVYLLESAGLHVQLNGCGAVSSQSIAAGSKINKGQTCILQLSI